MNVPNIEQLELSYHQSEFGFSLLIDDLLKWDRRRLVTSGVFVGSSDRENTMGYKLACQYTNLVREHARVSLVSVIGGCFFLDLVARVKFDRVILFDENVAEYGKLALMLNAACHEGADGRQVSEGVERLLNSNAAAVLPHIGNRHLGIDFSRQTPAGALYEGERLNTGSALFPPSRYPDCAWSACREETGEVVASLKESLVKRMFTRFPVLDANRHFVVVFASNAAISDAHIRDAIKNCAGVSIIRSSSSSLGHKAPHPYWEAVANSCLAGRSHQLWNTECRNHANTPSLNGCVTTASCLEDEDLDASLSRIPEGTDTILMHILLGHGKAGLAHKQARIRLIQEFLRRVPTFASRLVIAEFNPEGEMFRRMQPIGTLRELQETLEPLYSESGFALSGIRFAPGSNDARRNVFFIVDRKLG